MVVMALSYSPWSVEQPSPPPHHFRTLFSSHPEPSPGLGRWRHIASDHTMAHTPFHLPAESTLSQMGAATCVLQPQVAEHKRAEAQGCQATHRVGSAPHDALHRTRPAAQALLSAVRPAAAGQHSPHILPCLPPPPIPRPMWPSITAAATAAAISAASHGSCGLINRAKVLVAGRLPASSPRLADGVGFYRALLAIIGFITPGTERVRPPLLPTPDPIPIHSVCTHSSLHQDCAPPGTRTCIHGSCGQGTALLIPDSYRSTAASSACRCAGAGPTAVHTIGGRPGLPTSAAASPAASPVGTYNLTGCNALRHCTRLLGARPGLLAVAMYHLRCGLAGLCTLWNPGFAGAMLGLCLNPCAHGIIWLFMMVECFPSTAGSPSQRSRQRSHQKPAQPTLPQWAY